MDAPRLATPNLKSVMAQVSCFPGAERCACHGDVMGPRARIFFTDFTVIITMIITMNHDNKP